MKVDFTNHYNCSVTLCDENDGLYDAPTTFEDINAALAYCKAEIDIRQQAISAVIWDTMTGEVYATCGFDEDDIAEEDCPNWDDDEHWGENYYGDAVDYSDWDSDYLDDGCPIEDTSYLGEDGYAIDDDIDESNYDPYAGCDMYETYDIGGDF